MVKIGVVCEGPSDYPSVEQFFGAALAHHGISAEFVSLFPELDRTRPEGGWANVLLWLGNHPPATRIQRYFQGGLFGGGLSSDKLDAILIQLDSDVLEEASFRKFVKNKFKADLDESVDPTDKVSSLRMVIALAANFSDMTLTDVRRHVIAPAIESTEAWCVAAFSAQHKKPDELRGGQLTVAFMYALEKSEGRIPRDNYSWVDKSSSRRRRFCERHSGGVQRIIATCAGFSETLSDLVGVSGIAELGVQAST